MAAHTSRARRFAESAELYDAIYQFKNYARECERLRALIDDAVPAARAILDVACGTGEHARYLREHFTVHGIDINENYLRAARMKNPAGDYTLADMTDFDLGRTYDVVTCLFSAIGRVMTFEQLERAIACMARHVRPGGALIVEPWFTPDQWKPGSLFVHAGDIGATKVFRMSLSGREGAISTLLYHYLRGTPENVEHYTERLELALFTRDEMTWAFESAGLAVRYDSEGLMGRGLYLATQRV
jgi:ubiquinone/menaquinone biosynthesis C-methylase UbiE